MPWAQRRTSFTAIGSRSCPPPSGMPTHLSTSEVSILVRDGLAIGSIPPRARKRFDVKKAERSAHHHSDPGGVFFAGLSGVASPSSAECAARRTTGGAPRHGGVPRAAEGAEELGEVGESGPEGG